MTNWWCLRDYLPQEWLTALSALPADTADLVQELRIRADRPVGVSLPDGEQYLCAAGLSTMIQPDVFVCTARQLERCFLRFCQDSVYAHEWELQQGYIAVPGGIRVGVAGQAVTRDGHICSVRSVTALCVRMPRHIAGCAADLRRCILASGYPVSTLLVGPPSSGKTTLLRDLAAGLAAQRYRVSVVDERGELAGPEGLPGCDVLRGYPKAEGVRQAVRCLAPDAILFDELGDRSEIEAVAACAHAGVAVVASLHGHDPETLACQPLPRLLLEQRAFVNWAFLAGRSRPGQIGGLYRPEVDRNGIHWTSVDPAGRYGIGAVCGPSPATAGGVFAADRPSAADADPAVDLYRPADGRVMALSGGYAAGG